MLPEIQIFINILERLISNDDWNLDFEQDTGYCLDSELWTDLCILETKYFFKSELAACLVNSFRAFDKKFGCNTALNSCLIYCLNVLIIAKKSC